MLAPAAAATLNHLLAQSGWAPQRLLAHAGKTARIKVTPFSYAFTIQPDGLLRAASTSVSADAELMLSPALLPRLALQDEGALAEIVTLGDATLIEAIFFLARNLRWDAAEDISKVTGDIAAERIVGFAKSTHRNARDAALNLAQAANEYWTEERPLIASRPQLEEFKRSVSALRDAVDMLEQRISGISR